MKTKKTTEDYLKTIYILSQTEDVHACMIADQLGVSRPTVSVFMKRLSQEGYLNVDPHNVITLTKKGKEIAGPVYERYQILKKVLLSIGVSEKNASHDACEMEHGLGEESYEAVKKIAQEYDARMQRTDDQ